VKTDVNLLVACHCQSLVHVGRSRVAHDLQQKPAEPLLDAEQVTALPDSNRRRELKGEMAKRKKRSVDVVVEEKSEGSHLMSLSLPILCRNMPKA
jgi:hypothetical protein